MRSDQALLRNLALLALSIRIIRSDKRSSFSQELVHLRWLAVLLNTQRFGHCLPVRHIDLDERILKRLLITREVAFRWVLI